MNCTFCTTSIIARLKGYDVSANGNAMGASYGMMEKWFKDAKFEPAGHENFEDSLANIAKVQGDGAYGNMVVKSDFFAHSVFYMVENGTTRIFDGQRGKEYSIDDLKNTLFVDPEYTAVCRLDNKEFTDNALWAFKKRS